MFYPSHQPIRSLNHQKLNVFAQSLIFKRPNGSRGNLLTCRHNILSIHWCTNTHTHILHTLHIHPVLWLIASLLQIMWCKWYGRVPIHIYIYIYDRPKNHYTECRVCWAQREVLSNVRDDSIPCVCFCRSFWKQCRKAVLSSSSRSSLSWLVRKTLDKPTNKHSPSPYTPRTTPFAHNAQREEPTKLYTTSPWAVLVHYSRFTNTQNNRLFLSVWMRTLSGRIRERFNQKTPSHRKTNTLSFSTFGRGSLGPHIICT